MNLRPHEDGDGKNVWLSRDDVDALEDALEDAPEILRGVLNV